MTRDQFQDGLRALMNIDADEVAKAIHGYDGDFQAMPEEVWKDWIEFRENPYRWFVRAPDAKAQAIWKIVAERTKDATPMTPVEATPNESDQ